MRTLKAASLACAAIFSSAALASSHREAPLITETPKVDGTDFYMFRSYEPGRNAYVTLIANYLPLQDSYGGPNYFSLDPDALYEVHIDNNGDASEDLTFQFRFTSTYADLKVPTGAPTGDVSVPLINIGNIDKAGGNLNVKQTYSLTLIRGDRRMGTASPVTDADSGATSFAVPADNIGTKSIPDYAAYASEFVHPISVPGCATSGRVFVGQRREGFAVNLGQVFDLINLNPLSSRDSASNVIGNKSVTSLALELPASCLVAGGDSVIGAWTTASLRQSRVLNPSPAGPVKTSMSKGPTIEGGAWTQVSRLGSPLVNEVVIGITDKDKFNASQPKNDVENFGTYVLYPTLPVLVNVLFQVPPPATPRNDLLAAFVTGITAEVNGQSFKFTAPANLTVPGEMLRLNTAVAPVAFDQQKDLGFLDCDLAGYPNGRRPIDDVVDIALTVVEGAIAENALSLQTCDVSGATPVVVNEGAVVNDGAVVDAATFLDTFPYLGTPLPGSL